LSEHLHGETDEKTHLTSNWIPNNVTRDSTATSGVWPCHLLCSVSVTLKVWGSLCTTTLTKWVTRPVCAP